MLFSLKNAIISATAVRGDVTEGKMVSLKFYKSYYKGTAAIELNPSLMFDRELY